MTNLIPRSFGLASEAPVDFYNMLDDFFSAAPRRTEPFKVDVQENDEGYIVEADLPGVAKEAVSVELKENKLTIAVNYEEEKSNEDEAPKNYIHRERRRVSMSRGAYLKDADAEGVKARLENGVLTVEVPKKTQLKDVHKIEIL
jgi:HSP20 family protein